MKPNARYPEAYGPAQRLSTRRVSAIRWRLIVTALLGSLALWLALLVFVLGGGADLQRGFSQRTPVAPTALTWAANRAGFAFFTAAPLDSRPVLVEAQAAPDGAWGLWVGPDAASAQVLLVEPQGYISAQLPEDWQPFIHVHSGSNRISAQVTTGGIVWRVNDEIVVTTATSGPPLRVGVIIQSASDIAALDMTIAMTSHE